MKARAQEPPKTSVRQALQLALLAVLLAISLIACRSDVQTDDAGRATSQILQMIIDGQLDSARRLAEDMVIGTEAALGQDSWQFAFSMALLALVRQGQGDSDRAERYFMAAASIVERTQGESSLLGDIYFAHGWMYLRDRRADDALFFLKKSLSIYEELGDASYPFLMATLEYIELSYSLERDFANAAVFLSKRIDFEIKSIGFPDSTALKHSEELSLLLDHLGDCASSYRLAVRLWGFETTFQDSALRALGRITLKAARCNAVAGNFSNAVALYNRMLARQRLLDLLSPLHQARLYNEFGRVLVSAGNLASAATKLEKGYQMLLESSDAEQEEIEQALQDYSAVRAKLGNMEASPPSKPLADSIPRPRK